MDVGIDVSALRQTQAGTARYIRGLLGGLEQTDVDLHPFSFGGPGRLTALARDAGWYPVALPLAARRKRVAVLHCPTFRGPLRASVPLVVTVHDLAVLRHPEAFNRWTRAYSRAVVPLVVRAARRVIAVSRFTASELHTVLGVPAERIVVIPHGTGPPFEPAGAAEDGNYVLCVGTLEPRKNLARLVEAFARAKLDGFELRIVGSAGWGNVRVTGEHVRWLGAVPDDELARLYRGARCVAYVSLYEGFGLPVLEALACSAPVVAANIPPLREVAGDAAVYVDPLDPDAIARGLREAVSRREELVAAGVEQARRFSWKQAAEETVAVYRDAAR
ncbi:MAG: glycosyltransferase family 4 protein [Actinomycetota bacterium]|nr:glycosyltransferase family 4 protein [Actinomycetota bacterium]